MEFHFVFGAVGKSSIREINFDDAWEPYSARLHRVRNISWKGVLLFQLGVLRIALGRRWDGAIFLGDMNVISTWIAALLMKLRGRRVYFWGHGIYGNERGAKLWLRRRFLSIADGHFLYGMHGKRMMESYGFNNSQVHVVYNSLDHVFHRANRRALIDSEFYASSGFFASGNLPVLIFIGRLNFNKKLELLIDAVERLRSENMLVNLLLIGEGPARHSLESMAAALSGNVHFYGACYDEWEIGKLLSNADLCVSPGNAGLTAIHALSFGTPVCTHGDMTSQMPEAEAIEEGRTGVLYDLTKEDLHVAIRRWIAGNIDREWVRRNCYRVIDEKYNSDFQLGVFKRVLVEDGPR